jgi:hypothetical protein
MKNANTVDSYIANASKWRMTSDCEIKPLILDKAGLNDKYR